mmetsp:Transcript_6496/g.14343  ORF Transcript_6496/g.14343 Transcript_6496/m.14343 type:complete len:221 (-) Transcript_6496:152-814(-)
MPKPPHPDSIHHTPIHFQNCQCIRSPLPNHCPPWKQWNWSHQLKQRRRAPREKGRLYEDRPRCRNSCPGCRHYVDCHRHHRRCRVNFLGGSWQHKTNENVMAWWHQHHHHHRRSPVRRYHPPLLPRHSNLPQPFPNQPPRPIYHVHPMPTLVHRMSPQRRREWTYCCSYFHRHRHDTHGSHSVLQCVNRHWYWVSLPRWFQRKQQRRRRHHHHCHPRCGW